MGRSRRPRLLMVATADQAVLAEAVSDHPPGFLPLPPFPNPSAEAYRAIDRPHSIQTPEPSSEVSSVE